MKYYLRSSLFIFVVTVAIPLSAARGDDMEILKQVLLSREEQVVSLKAGYSLTQKGFGKDDATWKNEQTLLWTYKGDVYKRERNFIHSADGPITKVFSNYNGIITSFQTGDYAVNNKGAAGIVGWKEDPEPKGAYLNPRLAAFGYYEGKMLKDRFKEGNLYSWNATDHQKVLTWVAADESDRYDYYLDKEFRLVKIIYGTVPVSKYQEIYPQTYKDYPKEVLFNVTWTIEMSDFAVIDGVSIPLKAVKRWMAYAEDTPQLADGQQNGEDRFERQFMGLKKCTVEQTMQIDPATVQVNPELEEKDLKIIFPKGTFVYDKLLDLHFQVGDSMEDEISGMVDSIKTEISNPDRDIITNGTDSVENTSRENGTKEAAVSLAADSQKPVALPTGSLTTAKTSNKWLIIIAVVGVGIFFVVLSRLRKRA